MRQYKNNVPIFSMKMAGYLMYNGCILMDVAPNRSVPGRHVYYFADTAEFHRKQREYLSTESRNDRSKEETILYEEEMGRGCN